MTIGEKLKEKSRNIADTLKQRYRQHIGEELAEKAQSISDRETSLDRRERAISEQEKKLAKYYLVPRIYIQLPVFAAFCVGMYFAYKAVQPLMPESRNDAAPSVSDSSGSGAPDYSTCVQRGTEYYKEMGSYPALSTGEDAESKVRQMCSNSGYAFPE